ncbi:MAG: GAF domain-containing protein [Anaerolineales bacterium]|nr:GAF domain-containing protein [Anaerolineales bacterium]
MKTQLTNLKLPTSVWQSLHKIDNLLGRPLPWPKRLEEINNILLETLEVDAIWLLTIKPLPPTACGVMCTPLAVAPNAQVCLVDKAPPLADSWAGQNSLLSRVITSKKPHFVQPHLPTKEVHGNGQTDSDLGDVFFGAFNAIPSAIIPLVSADKPVGALVVGSQDLAKVPLAEEAQNLLVYLGEHLGAHLQNAYLVERSRRHASALMTLNQIAHAITSSMDLDEVLRRTMAGINEMLEVEAGSILLVDEETDELYFKITLRGENKQVTSFRLKRDEGIAGWVVVNNQATISNNAQTDKRFCHVIDDAIGFRTNTVLCVPLMVHGQAIGALEVINKRTGPFDDDDMELLVSMAASLGIALENASLYDEAQARAYHQEMITQIIATVNAGHGLSDTAKIIFAQLGRLLPFDHMSVSLLEGQKGHFRQWTFSEYGSIEQTKTAIPLRGSALAEIIKKNQASISADISKKENRPLYPDDSILLEDGIKSKLSIPLTTPKGPFGSLNLGRRLPDAYHPRDLKLLEQLISQVAVAIEKARLIDVLEQRTTELQMLNHMGEMLASTTDLNLILDTTLSMLPRLLPGDVQSVIVAGEEGCYLGVAVPFAFTKTEEIIDNILNTFAEMNEGQPSKELITSKTIAGNMPVPANWKSASVFSLPIITRRGLLGLIYMASGREENLSDDLLRIFSLIVSQISAAVENALLFHQVEQERARLAAILASSTDAVLVVNRHGRIVLDNPAAWEVMGVETSRSNKLLKESTHNEMLVNLFESAMQGERPTGEIRLMDGRTFYANLSPVSAGEAGVIGWVATMQDVSHFKELNELKSDFVNAVSHDLRSPLSGIMIAAHLLPQIGPINDQQQELLSTVEDRVRNMGALIDDLLDVGKIEAGIDFEMEPTPITPIIYETMNSFMPQAHDKSIHLTSQLEKESPLVVANTSRLRQVLNNLVGNAIKYTPPNGQVTVKAFRHEDEVWIQVVDTGMGIPAADQPHIFEKFYRVRGDHVANIKGTGLGLALVQSIVEKHQGRIWLESVFGEGSTFTVALPIYTEVDFLEDEALARD